MPSDTPGEKCHPVFLAAVIRLFLSLFKYFRADLCRYKCLNFTILSAGREKSNFYLEGSLSSSNKKCVSYIGSYSEISFLPRLPEKFCIFALRDFSIS